MLLMSSVGIYVLGKAPASDRARLSPGAAAEILWEERKDKGRAKVPQAAGTLVSLAVAGELRRTSGSHARFHWALVFHGRNRSTSGYTLFVCHPVYVDISQETLQLIVLFAFKGRKPAGCPSLPCARTGGQR